MCKHIVEVVWKLIVHKFIPKFQALNIKYIFYFLSMWMFEERFSVCVISTVFHHSKGPFFAVLMCPIQSPSFTGVKQCTFHWLISNDVSQKEMVLNSLNDSLFDYNYMHQLRKYIYYISTKNILMLFHFTPVESVLQFPPDIVTQISLVRVEHFVTDMANIFPWLMHVNIMKW